MIYEGEKTKQEQERTKQSEARKSKLIITYKGRSRGDDPS
jgi:hypothetical protein